MKPWFENKSSESLARSLTRWWFVLLFLNGFLYLEGVEEFFDPSVGAPLIVTTDAPCGNHGEAGNPGEQNLFQTGLVLVGSVPSHQKSSPGTRQLGWRPVTPAGNSPRGFSESDLRAWSGLQYPTGLSPPAPFLS